MTNTFKNAYSKHTNKNIAVVLTRYLLSVCVLVSLNACGQRGSLYIPNTPEAAQRSTIGDVLTKPTSPASTSTPATTATQTPTAPAK